MFLEPLTIVEYQYWDQYWGPKLTKIGIEPMGQKRPFLGADYSFIGISY